MKKLSRYSNKSLEMSGSTPIWIMADEWVWKSLKVCILWGGLKLIRKLMITFKRLVRFYQLGYIDASQRNN